MSSSSKPARVPIKNQRIQEEREGKEERQEAKRSQQQEQAQQKRSSSLKAARTASSQPAVSENSSSSDDDSNQSARSDDSDDEEDAESEASSSSSSSSSSISAGINCGQLALYTHLPSPVAIPPNSIHLTYLHSFLSAAECSSLLSLADNFVPSVIGFSSADASVDPSRTSSSSSLRGRPSPVHRAVRERIAKLLGCKDEQIQTLSVVRYKPGQQYKPHYDSSLHRRWKPRQFTIFAYLNDLEGGGGETEFTKLGIKFKPKRGDALLWKNHASKTSRRHDDGQHAGLPPVSGTKYGLNCWVEFPD